MQSLEKLNNAEKLIDKLNCGVFLLVVEGKRDAAALCNIGITAEIMQANGKPEFIVNKIARKNKGGLRPVLLFDFDTTGWEKLRQLEQLLLAHDIVPDTRHRLKFRQIFGLHFFEDAHRKYNEVLEKTEKTNR